MAICGCLLCESYVWFNDIYIISMLYLRLNIMKTFSTLIFLYVNLTSFAQQPEYKYNIGLAGGWLKTIAESGPKNTTEVGDVKFLRPWYTANGSIYFDIHLYEKWLVGIEVGVDQCDFGYEATPIYSFNGLSSGSLSSGAYVYTYKAGARLLYRTKVTKKIDVTTVLNPALGYYPFSDYFIDTANSNAYMHNTRAPGTGKVQYIHYPAYQNDGLFFTVKGTLVGSYKLSNRMSLTVDVAYQQGFSSFLIDSISIRQYEPSTLKRYEQVFYTKLNGTSFQYHIGIYYRFGKNERL